MSNFFYIGVKFKGASAAESQKVQAAWSLVSIFYDAANVLRVTVDPEPNSLGANWSLSSINHVVSVITSTAPTEPNSLGAAWVLSSVDNQNTLIAAIAPAEPNKLQAAWSIASLNYA